MSILWQSKYFIRNPLKRERGHAYAFSLRANKWGTTLTQRATANGQRPMINVRAVLAGLILATNQTTAPQPVDQSSHNCQGGKLLISIIPHRVTPVSKRTESCLVLRFMCLDAAHPLSQIPWSLVWGWWRWCGRVHNLLTFIEVYWGLIQFLGLSFGMRWTALAHYSMAEETSVQFPYKYLHWGKASILFTEEP